MVEQSKAGAGAAARQPASGAKGAYAEEQAVFSPDYESGEDYNNQGTGEDADYEETNTRNPKP